MRILITTQVVDRTHPVLGFFHHWIEEIAKQYDQVTVICLHEGEYALPQNVTVHSLGKEKVGSSVFRRFIYVRNFLKLITSHKDAYDSVLVHMNPEYVILGGLLWKHWKKKVVLWYNHPHGGVRLWLASQLADTVLHTSPYAASARTKKAIRMPVGIDTELFTPAEGEKYRYAMYMQGRVAPSKRVEVLLDAVKLMHAEGIPVTLSIVGPEDEAYAAWLREHFKDLIDEEVVHFLGPKKHSETPALYRVHGVSVNLAAAGHFDKTAFESMACGTPVVVSSPAFVGIVPPRWIVPGNDSRALADELTSMVTLPDEEYEALAKQERDIVLAKHSLTALMQKLPSVL